jgi:hypothetical protein
MLTLRRLMQNTPSDVVARSRKTTAMVMKVSRSRRKDLDTVVFTVRCKAVTESQYYDIEIELYPGEIHENVFERISMDNPCWVSCSCPNFLFVAEYALAKHGSSRIEYSNGKRPVITNPREIPFLCKHIYRAAPEAVAQAFKMSKQDKAYKFIKT